MMSASASENATIKLAEKKQQNKCNEDINLEKQEDSLKVTSFSLYAETFKNFNLFATDEVFKTSFEDLKNKISKEPYAEILVLDFIFNNHKYQDQVIKARLDNLISLSNQNTNYDKREEALVSYIPQKVCKEFYEFISDKGYFPDYQTIEYLKSSNDLIRAKAMKEGENLHSQKQAYENFVNTSKYDNKQTLTDLLKNYLERINETTSDENDHFYELEIIKAALETQKAIDPNTLGRIITYPETVKYLIDNMSGLDIQLFFNGAVQKHIFRSSNAVANKYKIDILDLLLKKGVQINHLDLNGQTAIFKVADTNVAEFLIANGADYKISDNDGQSWIADKPISIVKFAINKGYTPDDISQNIKSYFFKGHYDTAKMLYEHNPVFHPKLIDDFSTAIKTALQNSVEPNKYHAVLNLMKTIGLNIPNQFSHLLYNPSDTIDAKEFSFIESNFHHLAKYYLKFAASNLKTSLEKTCDGDALGSIINKAFAADNSSPYADFEKLKLLCAESIILNKVQTPFDAYYETLGKALNLMDTDFATMVLTINGLPPYPSSEEARAYRGINLNIDDNEISNWFNHNHRAFISFENQQKFLGFYVMDTGNSLSNFKGSMKERGGTYVSLKPEGAAHFAKNSFLKVQPYIVEMKFQQGNPVICGSKYWIAYNFNIHEMAPSNIEGDDIIAIYKLNAENLQILKVFQNPYVTNSTPKFKEGDILSSDYSKPDEAIDAIFKNLRCEEFTSNHDYKNYTEFTKTFTHFNSFLSHAQVYEDFFANRPDFSSPFALVNDCDQVMQCCS